MRDDLSLLKNFILDLSMGRTMSVGPAKVSAVRSLFARVPPMPPPAPATGSKGKGERRMSHHLS